jgi:hypothetical protein
LQITLWGTNYEFTVTNKDNRISISPLNPTTPSTPSS